ncbi:ISAs1 family transposase [Trinickia sp. LjRoot230]|uniref:ISAs1 family transposase n=1 Tax=Trinickia sp. LjRoot230 TaxID=3342288 RepID=UPI003ECE510F
MILLFPRGSELPGKQSEKSFRAEKGYVRRHETVEKDHGRFETRRTVVSTELGWLAQKDEWAGLQAEAMVESSREIGGKISCERRYDLFSMTDVTRIALSIRQHWAIENQQHWILGVQFVEDARRTRKTIPPPSWPDSPGSPQFAATGYFQQGQHPASQDAFALRFKLPRNPALQTARCSGFIARLPWSRGAYVHSCRCSAYGTRAAPSRWAM